jgi:hypothetical protein
VKIERPDGPSLQYSKPQLLTGKDFAEDENKNGCRGSSACVSWLRCGAVADMPLIKFWGSLGNYVHGARVVVTTF